MVVQHFFDTVTSTLTYVVHAGQTAVVIDPVRDFDAASGRTAWTSAGHVAAYIDEQKLSVPWVIDTHAHADHMSGLPYFRTRYGARTITGIRVGDVQRTFRDVYNLDPAFPADGRQFDKLLDEGDELEVGMLRVRAMHTPGHTPAHMSWRIGNAVFLGDTLFMPDYGTARCDFPGGSAEELFESVQRLYALPADTGVFVCHDYRPGGRPLRFQSTIGEQRSSNVQLNAYTTKSAFVAFRKHRDATLEAPALMLASLQVNVRAGDLPEPEANGVSYLKIPLDRL